MQLYRASDALVKHREVIEAHLFERAMGLFEERAEKERGIVERFAVRFETALTKLNDGLSRPRAHKRLDQIWQRIGPLKAKHSRVAAHYQVGVTADETGQPRRADGHLFITVIAYQLVQVIRTRLRAQREHASWTTLRRTLEGQQRVTATFRRPDGRTLHVRTATQAETAQRAIYDALGVDPQPGGVRKSIV